jgi:hypothetical protein
LYLIEKKRELKNQKSFDFSKYRSPNDTDIEWQYKKLFIETNHGKIEDKSLVCLAQCYSNVERLGVR